jgi:hypothetical protein
VSDAAIKAALQAAGEAARVALTKPGVACGDPICTIAPCECARDGAAAAIVAFLRALPDRFAMPGEHNPACQVLGHAACEMRKLAAAVEQEARGDG